MSESHSPFQNTRDQAQGFEPVAGHNLDSGTSIWPSVEPSRGPQWFENLLAWIGPRRGTLLLATGAFQLLVLAGMAVLHGMPLVTGETIQLEVRPVDPRDLFRGDYVILRYTMNDVPLQGIEGLPDSRDQSYAYAHGPRRPEEETVYVTLEPAPDTGLYRGVKTSIHRPESGKYIRGTYHRNYYDRGRIEFSGIQSYYVPEGTGKSYEDAARQNRLSAEVALTANGKAALRCLHIRSEK